ncbi:hypothetical protein SSX86_004019 [Deinandra increscens subsp. villosa]|uniref:Gag protein n=1 Tax=Deinandra increscens subsp. villosa TaxID=3103831 RepID=A0AAP0H8F3_9ASTR
MASSSNSFSSSNIFHSIQNKLDSNNYLIWVNQMTPLFEYQELLSHIDGSSPPPAETVTTDGKTAPNPLYTAWKNTDKQAIILLNASLSPEAFTETIGFTTAREKWEALAAVFSNSSMAHVQNLRDQLHSITQGSSSVSDFGRRFKAILDRLAAVGHPVTEEEKTHYFYRGLAPSFDSFSVALRVAHPNITLRELQAQAESTEIFAQNSNNRQPSVAAFNAQSNNRSGNNRGRGNSQTRNSKPWRWLSWQSKLQSESQFRSLSVVWEGRT